MRRAVIVTLAAIAALLVAAQFLLPAYIEGRIEDHMERGGGTADAYVSAFPAVRLLARHGRRLELSGSGLVFGLTRQERVFKDLDGFDEVEIALEDSRAGPIVLDRMFLAREGEGEAYEVKLDGSASPREVATFLGERFGGPLGGFFGGIAGGTLSDMPLPFAARAQIESDDGRARVTSTTGTVAGLPAGPLAEIVAAAVVSQL